MKNRWDTKASGVFKRGSSQNASVDLFTPSGTSFDVRSQARKGVFPGRKNTIVHRKSEHTQEECLPDKTIRKNSIDAREECDQNGHNSEKQRGFSKATLRQRPYSINLGKTLNPSSFQKLGSLKQMANAADVVERRKRLRTFLVDDGHDQKLVASLLGKNWKESILRELNQAGIQVEPQDKDAYFEELNLASKTPFPVEFVAENRIGAKRCSQHAFRDALRERREREQSGISQSNEMLRKRSETTAAGLANELLLCQMDLVEHECKNMSNI